MARYIDADKLCDSLRESYNRLFELYKKAKDSDVATICEAELNTFMECIIRAKTQPTADVVEVVRCKDCIYFQPDFVWTNDGNRRPYTEEEIQKGKNVTAEVGINCGSRCQRKAYWEENSIPVWFNENDFCIYGKNDNDLEE